MLANLCGNDSLFMENFQAEMGVSCGDRQANGDLIAGNCDYPSSYQPAGQTQSQSASSSVRKNLKSFFPIKFVQISQAKQPE